MVTSAVQLSEFPEGSVTVSVTEMVDPISEQSNTFGVTVYEINPLSSEEPPSI